MKNSHKISAREARTNFAELINKAAFGKEVIAIQRHNQVVAYVVPPEFIKLIEDYEDRMAIEQGKNEESEPWGKVKEELGLV